MSIKLSICIVLLAVLCCYTQGAFARQQLRDRQEQAQGALESTSIKNTENQLTETNNEAANHIGEQSKIETVLRKGTQDKDDDDAEDKDDVDGTRRRRGRRGRRRNRRRRGRGRRRGRRGGRRRRGRRGGRRRRNRRRG
ncbi:protamine [Bactrocera tryoni]|uniref:protamine n=1 Tax=Bactrocera tryoni TaxID=59916 RepID=UPI001A989D74|nr:protamine [Bactrocera tryoni]